MIFDTHAHYDDEAFDPDRDSLLASMPAAGVHRIINACASAGSLDVLPGLMEQWPFLYGAAGIHPDDAPLMTTDTAQKIRDLARCPKTVAIGEIGLDYYWHRTEEEHRLQKTVFRLQMDLAREENLPFMVHSRDAAADTLSIVREYMEKGMAGGVIHCYSYSWEIAQQYLDMGLYLGIGGVVTYKNGRKLKEVVQKAPLSRLLLETDCPYLSPVPYRGKRNCSLNLPLVAEAIAELKGITREEVIKATWENACRVYPKAA